MLAGVLSEQDEAVQGTAHCLLGGGGIRHSGLPHIPSHPPLPRVLGGGLLGHRGWGRGVLLTVLRLPFQVRRYPSHRLLMFRNNVMYEERLNDSEKVAKNLEMSCYVSLRMNSYIPVMSSINYLV